MIHDEPIRFETVMGYLLQLQKLEVILAESTIIHKDSPNFPQIIDDIKNQITTLEKQIPDDIFAQYNRLRRQGQTAIAKVSPTGKCTSCHVTIPIGSLQQMAGERLTPICPNCSKYLHVW